jgi:ketosteroid isomerase-like protein
MSDWVHPYYDDVDNMRLAEFVAWHAPDVTVQFANHPRPRGHDPDARSHRPLLGDDRRLKHNISNVWDTGDGTTVVEADIDYTRLDGKVVVTPCVTLLHRVEQGIDSVRIFVDLAPVFAPAEAPADAVTA